MAINFPSNPTQSQIYTFNNSIWIYNGYAWVLASSAGTSGTSGTSGSGSGTSGSGAPGTSGSGSSGTSGIGFSGTSGSSGTSGIGFSGTDGTSGTSGIGTHGTSGSSGTSGTRGTSGSSGTSGTRGTSGTSGSSGTSGVGTPGTPGTSGTSGTSASGGGSSFTYAYTLFVDPNGNDVTALEGRLDLPWQTIGSAIQYCEDNTLGNYTIWAFPGIYVETKTWIFKYSINTTIKLNGGVKVIFNLKKEETFLIGITTDCSIVGDDRENNYDSPNALITFDVESHYIPETMFFLNSADISVRISNVSLYADIYRYAFNLAHASNVRLHIVNSFIRALRNNIIVTDSSTSPKVAITNSILVCGDGKDRQYANIRLDSNFGSNPEVINFNGIWNFENVRFISYGDTEIGTEKGHITSNTLGAEFAMYVTLSNCKFYMNHAGAIDIWYDNGTLGNNRLEIVGTSIANSDSDYNSLGSSVVRLGLAAFIVTGIDIIDPIDIMI
jgi:hypothetical protein